MTQDVNVTLVGLNRRSASLGMALRAYSTTKGAAVQFHVTGQDGSKDAMAAAKHFEAVDQTENNAQSAVRYANIVIVSLPPSVMEAVYEYMSPALKPGTVVLDLSLNKAATLDIEKKYFPRDAQGGLQAYLVGIQPLVATPYLYETREGVEAGHVDLFKNSEMVVAPSPSCPEEAVKLASDLAAFLEMRVHFMAPDEYERMVNFTENLPMLMGLMLFASLQQSRGSQDMRRLVNSRLALMMHSLREAQAADFTAQWAGNTDAIQSHIDILIQKLYELKDLAGQQDDDQLRDYFQNTLALYQHWEEKRTSGKWEETGPNQQSGGFFTGWFGFGKSG